MNSFLKVYVFFLMILLGSILFVLYPPEGESKKQRSKEEFASLEVSGFTLLNVAKNKPASKIWGKRGMQFEDREEFWDFSIINYDKDIGGLKNLKTQGDEEQFFATHGIKKGSHYFFDGGVKYTNTDGMSFEANEGSYIQRIFQTKGAFYLKSNEGEFWGEDLFFDSLKQEFRADLPKGKVWLKG